MLGPVGLSPVLLCTRRDGLFENGKLIDFAPGEGERINVHTTYPNLSGSMALVKTDAEQVGGRLDDIRSRA
jgi:hypothetical protein